MILLAAFSPWALMRLLPLHELAAGLEGMRARGAAIPTGIARADDASEIAQQVLRQLPPGDDVAPEEPAAVAAVRGLDADGPPDQK